ncbi:MAG: SufE family protein [Chitinophagales bacterium]|nr:SufE family protein [Chitinophagales bacterium]
METIDKIQQDIIEDFSMYEDWADKYEYIIEMGKTLAPLEEKYKTEDYRIHGCQSQVWLHADFDGKNIHFHADSDAFITKGLIALLVKVLSGHAPKAIIDIDLYFLSEIGLKEHLSPTRANGLASMVKQMKTYALAYQTKQVS